ncbi:MAG: EamA family transporter [Xanthomonadaceae bacterium]|nr:EamA family transporter [Xanthomonadaceae bacterium]MDE1958534.1 EamA family transporter [Xanthomonadaceae bacterium]MDE2178734.1 EamA family transporter [Xanthomonadaceae bacterium]MDE2246627.1 EamA family transporter [Xanthomonadaceae bacterium]
MSTRWRFYLVGFLLLMAIDTAAQLCFKLAALHAAPFAIDPGWLLRVLREPWVYGAIAGYLGAFVTYMTLLKHAPVGPAFAASHLQVVSVMAASAWLFGERLAPLQLLGAALIVLGILVLARAEDEVAQAETTHAC